MAALCVDSALAKPIVPVLLEALKSLPAQVRSASAGETSEIADLILDLMRVQLRRVRRVLSVLRVLRVLRSLVGAQPRHSVDAKAALASLCVCTPSVRSPQ